MKILIPLKQVPDSTVRVSVGPDGKSIKTEGVTWSISPYDEYAIEMALERKDAEPTTVVAVVTVGPARARDALRQALAMGCDEATLAVVRRDLDALHAGHRVEHLAGLVVDPVVPAEIARIVVSDRLGHAGSDAKLSVGDEPLHER